MKYCIKDYPSLYGETVGSCIVEFRVHYTFLWFFVRVTPVRQQRLEKPLERIPNGKRMWITTSGIGWVRL